MITIANDAVLASGQVSDVENEHRLVVMWPGGWVTRLASEAPVTVGRAEDCDLRVDEPSVSRRHLRVIPGDVIEVEDLGSANGTRVKGRRIAAHTRVPIAPGDLVEMGNAVLVLHSPSSSQFVAAAPSARMPRYTGTTGEMVARDPRTPETTPVEKLVAIVATSTLSVILLGETGTGKEVTAHRIHSLSPRRHGPFIRINCAALTETLLESELFGHERGAFTGAVKTKVGLLEAAHEGTFFLDEIGEMPLTTQAKMLRVLESRELLRVGSVEPRPIDVRIVAATNRDLPAMVGAGRFRSDLYFRLNGMTIRLPPLRERRGDIVPLAELFLRQSSTAAFPSLAPAAIAKLEAHSWPGNVRELRNAIERAVVLAQDIGVIDAHHLALDEMPIGAGAAYLPTPMPFPIPPPPGSAPGSAPGSVAPSTSPSPRGLADTIPPPGIAAGDLYADVEALERRRIAEALQAANGNQTKAAEMLGVSRRTLVSRLDAYQLPRPRKGR